MGETLAVVIAAGLGSRLRPHTDDLPKCMLDVQGSTMLQRALTTFSDLDVPRSVVIGGYKADQLHLPGECSLVMNHDFENNNILHSLAHAREQMSQAEMALISYSDIIFRKSVVEKLLAGHGSDMESDISIVVDQNWRSRYDGRLLHPLAQAEAAKFSERHDLLQIGKDILTEEHDSGSWGEFIGMMRMTPLGQEQFWSVFDDVNARFDLDAPFQGASAWRRAYITDLLQEMVDRGMKIHCSLIQGGWLEIDTTEDYETAAEFDFSEPGSAAVNLSDVDLSEDGAQHA